VDGEVTPEQRDILVDNVEEDGAWYTVVSIEYPSHSKGDNNCLKIVTREIEGDFVNVDWYDGTGRTVEHDSFVAREG
jgi:hypothetical protein